MCARTIAQQRSFGARWGPRGTQRGEPSNSQSLAGGTHNLFNVVSQESITSDYQSTNISPKVQANASIEREVSHI